MVNPTLEQHWRRFLQGKSQDDPVGAAALALQFLFNGSPFSDIRTLTARRDSAMLGNTTLLVGPASSGAGMVWEKVPGGQVFVLDEFDVRVDDNAGGTPDDAVLAGLALEFLLDDARMREIPRFAVDSYFCGKFGAVKKRLLLQDGRQLRLNLIETTAGGQTYDVFVSIVGRLEPKWLMQLAYLVPMHPEQRGLVGV